MCMALLVWIAMALASEEKKNSMPEVIVEGSPAVAAVVCCSNLTGLGRPDREMRPL